MMGGDSKNLILAVVLSLGVLLVYQYLVVSPQLETERARQAQIEAQTAQNGGAMTPQTTANGSSTNDGVLGSTPTAAPVNVGDQGVLGGEINAEANRIEVLAREPRIELDNSLVGGSISLATGRIDDLRLKTYHEKAEPGSPEIVLLSPSSSADPYFAEFGWRNVKGANHALPRKQEWKIQSGSKLSPGNPVTVAWDNGAGLKFTRRYEIDDKYMFTVTDMVKNATGTQINLSPYALVGRIGEPETTGFYILHEGLIGVLGEELDEYTYGEIEDDLTFQETSNTGGWVGITDKYWMTALIPDQTKPFTGAFRFGAPTGRKVYNAAAEAPPVGIAAGATYSQTTHFFAGAKVVDIINGYQEQLSISKFDLAVDWGWLYLLTKPMFIVLSWFFKLLGNFGLAILGLTVVIKAILFPLANHSYKAMSRMKKLTPEMTKLRERHGDDKPALQKAMMELYKTEKVNPLAGCLPIFVQIPVFFSLYKVLFVTIEMRHAPFYGWITDLSAPDPTTIFNLFGLLPYDLPVWMPVLGIWPVLMGVTMFLQQKLNPPPADPMQQKIFAFLPFVFTFILAPFAAGLVIYWTWNNFLSILQQATIMKRMGVPVEFYVGKKAKAAPKT